MWWALLNDLAQRLITLNKWEQRKNLKNFLQESNLSPSSKILDFGCGTGLFAKVYLHLGMKYTGYDIDSRLTDYAQQLYPQGTFTTNREAAQKAGPYDLIVANCCFHHIADAPLKKEIAFIQSMLSPTGKLLIIDILGKEEPFPWWYSLYLKLEQGDVLRKKEEYIHVIKDHFDIQDKGTTRSHLFSFPYQPIYNNLVFLECSPFS